MQQLGQLKAAASEPTTLVPLQKMDYPVWKAAAVL
jgi:hypothetical protein